MDPDTFDAQQGSIFNEYEIANIQKIEEWEMLKRAAGTDHKSYDETKRHVWKTIGAFLVSGGDLEYRHISVAGACVSGASAL